MVVAVVLSLGAAVLWLGAAGAAAATNPYAPLNRPGPRLSVPATALKTALSCTPGVARATRNPILLVPGTTLDPQPNFSWNYERAFSGMHWPYCTVTLPYHAMGDIQVAGEYVVYALRAIAATATRRVDVLGYSQGGMLPRWALRFWPDTRTLVRAVVALDPSNHGTLDAQLACHSSCPPAFWQQATGSHFGGALNSRAETFAGINYTVVYSRADEVVVPNLDAAGSSSLHTGRGRIANIAVQQICPSDGSDHLAMGTYDAVGYALGVDAFTHPGPADPGRISPAVCAQPFQPGVDPITFPADHAAFLAAIAQGTAQSPQTASEPPLRCYVFTACKAQAKHRARRRHLPR
jgi:triacylglycerol esterase/lipase EstA (alpha/beta hydrolase family)